MEYGGMKYDMDTLTREPDHDAMWAELESLDAAAMEAIERANGGPVPWGAAEHAAFSAQRADQQALMRVIGMISIADYKDAARVASAVSLRQSASETPAELVRRIALALLTEMAGLQP